MIVHQVSLIKLLTDRQPAFQVTLVLVERLSRSLWIQQQCYVGFLPGWKENKIVCYIALCYTVFRGIASGHGETLDI